MLIKFVRENTLLVLLSVTLTITVASLVSPLLPPGPVADLVAFIGTPYTPLTRGEP
ncbi:hypothetical protein ACIA8K_07145 [Catenuloplanes sp. NPDC051500]|uniref:hypothetical protein n=1 Tax=Catenuloplanes sp. NPDC051500 TaxID=3363959 RepID=UPI0037A8FF10